MAGLIGAEDEIRGWAREHGGQPLPMRRSRLVSLNFASLHQLDGWLRQVEALRPTA